ncbi:MAG TPA: hypothetical protein PKH53_07975, partial [Candidatus Saccharicenans sp.]|nr:hypothetical protein [Candidatus Saccharicenans sp.]
VGYLIQLIFSPSGGFSNSLLTAIISALLIQADCFIRTLTARMSKAKIIAVNNELEKLPEGTKISWIR